MKKIMMILYLLLIPMLALGQYGMSGYGHGGGAFQVVGDTTSVSKAIGKMYFYTVDNTIYVGNGTYLSQRADFYRLGVTSSLEIDGTVTGGMTVYGNKSTDTLLSVYNDKTGLTARDSSFVVLPTGQTNVSITGSAVGLSIDGNKTSGNLFQAINDNDGAVGDSSVSINSVGNVGVKTAPDATYGIKVSGKIQASNQIYADGISAVFSSNSIYGSYNGELVMGNTNTGSSAVLNIKNKNVSSIYIDNSQNVGIGTTAPGSKLEVKGAAMGSVRSDTLLSVFNDRYGAAPRDSSWNVLSDGTMGINQAVCYIKVVSLADGAQHLLPTGKAGFGKVSCNGEFATFYFLAAGNVSLVTAGTAGLTSANVTTTEDNDTTLNIFDDGDGIGIENELGSTLNVLIDITYF